MIKLNDYLYSGDTILKIIGNYTRDLFASAKASENIIDLDHCNFLLQLRELLEHNEFLTSQSQRLREFYMYMAQKYPELAFTFKGRIKSLIRTEEKYNGYIVEYTYDYYKLHGRFPTVPELKIKLKGFHDIIAYRVVISVPKCHCSDKAERRKKEVNYLYEIANELPVFLEERGFTAEIASMKDLTATHDNQMIKALMDVKSGLKEDIKPYYRDYVETPKSSGYQCLHITFYDNLSRSYLEVQLRTKEMDDFAEIGPANHFGYEKTQEKSRSRRDDIPKGVCVYFDDAYERVSALQQLKLEEVDVNMFAANSNHLVNDGCGLYTGRLILPYEHLSRFQNDKIY